MELILMMGIQGSGKTTQGKRLAEKCNGHYISTGDILRSHIERKTPIGLRYQENYKKGILAPDSMLFDMIKTELDIYGRSASDVVILDGFPRTEEQLKWMKDNYDVHLCVELDLREETASKRLLDRGRADDNEEGLKKRFSDYKEKTSKIPSYFKSIHRCITIDADNDVDNIFKLIIKIMTQYYGELWIPEYNLELMKQCEPRVVFNNPDMKRWPPGYTEEESKFSRKELDYWLEVNSLHDGDPLKEKARKKVLEKRIKFGKKYVKRNKDIGLENYY